MAYKCSSCGAAFEEAKEKCDRCGGAVVAAEQPQAPAGSPQPETPAGGN